MNTTAIIVTYNPNIPQFLKTLDSIINQVDTVIIVDNGSTIFTDLAKNTILINLQNNFGIAYAQNRGIEKAKELRADYILFSDQDTVYPENYVSSLLEKSTELENIGALCPVFFDKIKKNFAPVMLTKMKGVQPKKNKVYKVAHAISSGTLIPISVFNKVGLMQENLFIDFVDYEWCWRLEKYNLNIFCFSDIIIYHQLGDRMEKRFGIKIVSRSLFRFYYIIRNGYYLLTTDYLKGLDRFLFKLLMIKKIVETLLLNNFSFTSFKLIKHAVRNGKKNIFTNLTISLKYPVCLHVDKL